MLTAIRSGLLLEILPNVAAAVLVVAALQTMIGFVATTLDSGERRPWTREKIAVFARETVLRALFGTLAMIGHRPPAWPVAAGRVPVLLVPDPAWGPASMTFLARFLAARGLAPQVVVWARQNRTLSERATELDAAIEALRRNAGVSQIDLVAAGAGGVIAAMGLREIDRAARVRRMVALAVPFRGTRMAVYRHDDSARDLRVGALALDALLPVQAPVVSVWSGDDPEVIPASSAVADERHAVGIEGCGHLGLLLSARSFRAVHRALSEPVEAEPRPTSAPSVVLA
jgi:hypothetical protein